MPRRNLVEELDEIMHFWLCEKCLFDNVMYLCSFMEYGMMSIGRSA